MSAAEIIAELPKLGPGELREVNARVTELLLRSKPTASEEELSCMAADPQIQKELRLISSEWDPRSRRIWGK
jgi:hypothetical protein